MKINCQSGDRAWPEWRNAQLISVTQAPPSGTVTLLFTDIEGSTRLLQELGEQRFNEEAR